MKRYAVFAGDFYYPAGGWADFEAGYDTLEEASASLMCLVPPPSWGEVVDLELGEAVERWRHHWRTGWGIEDD